MTNRNARAAGRLVFILCCVTVSTGVLRAQNENETVGFQSNHAFDSGHFGENIDVLNGGLHLTVPIGPRYQVNDRLGYQIGLSYNSKVWDYSDYDAGQLTSVKPYNEGSMGIGFTLGFGRLLQDAHHRPCSGAGTPECNTRTWKWITPDGNQHDIWFLEDRTGNTTPDNTEYPLATTDSSHSTAGYPGNDCRTTAPLGEQAEH